MDFVAVKLSKRLGLIKGHVPLQILNIYINIKYDRKAHLAGDPKRKG